MKTTKIIAHRGLSSIYYQNTLTAFEKAAESKTFDGIETDIWQTADGVWVCSHDRDPFADSTLLVDCIPFSQAVSTPLNRNKSRKAKVENDVFICSFEEYLNVCKDWELTAVIELKSQVPKEQLTDLLSLIDGKLSLEKYVIISFYKENADNILEQNPDVNAQILTSNYILAKRYLNAGYNIGVNNRITTSNLIKRAQVKGREINVWTVNSSKRAKALINAGVNYLTTDNKLELQQNV